MVKQHKNSKLFLFRFILSLVIGLGCFYCIVEIAWPEVQKMQATYNERKNGQPTNLSDKGHLKATSFFKNLKSKIGQPKIVAQYSSNMHGRVSKNQLKLLEFVEFHKEGLLQKDLYQIFIKKVFTSNKNMATFFKWLTCLEKWQLIKVQSGRVYLTEMGSKFLQHTRKKNSFHLV